MSPVPRAVLVRYGTMIRCCLHHLWLIYIARRPDAAAMMPLQCTSTSIAVPFILYLVRFCSSKSCKQQYEYRTVPQTLCYFRAYSFRFASSTVLVRYCSRVISRITVLRITVLVRVRPVFCADDYTSTVEGTITPPSDYGCRRTSKKLLFALELVMPASSFLIHDKSGIHP